MVSAVQPQAYTGTSSLENAFSLLSEQEGMSTQIDIVNMVAIAFFEDECNLPIYIDAPKKEGYDDCIPLNIITLPEKLQKELGNNLMEWFYRFAENNVKGFRVPHPRKVQPVAQVISYTTACLQHHKPRTVFTLDKPSDRQLWVILRYDLSGTKYDCFVIDSASTSLERESIGFETDETVITVGISLVCEPSWSTQKRWEDIPFGFSAHGSFIAWGKFVRTSPKIDDLLLNKEKMVSECQPITEKAYWRIDELRVTMLERIGFNTAWKPNIITSKSCSLLALDFTSLIEYNVDGGVRVDGYELSYLKFFKVESYISTHPDVFTYAKGVGNITTLDPRKITLYHYDVLKQRYFLFDIEVATKAWSHNFKTIKPEELKYEGIEQRCAQYL